MAKSLNSVKTGPKSISECFVFSNTLKIAWVAQALWITWREKYVDWTTKLHNTCPIALFPDPVSFIACVGCRESLEYGYLSNLFGKEYFFQSAVLDNRPLRLVLCTPLVQKDQSMNWSTWEEGWRKDWGGEVMGSLKPRLSVLDFANFSPKLRDKIWNEKPGFEARGIA